ncbi:SPOC like C-terminal domain-containing protein [Limtongia smithiae]|uniref:SPOC like C-terminal domain-containing protein n=1 Tax=Limtongia smithiae TaxID=1125753 RepID=UPI0034CE6F7F
MAEKEATVFVIDLGHSMREAHMAPAGGRSDFELAMTYVLDKVGFKILTGRKTDMVGIIGVGTEETKNALQGNPGYEHISLLFKIQQFILSDFRALNDTVKPSAASFGDMISGLVLGITTVMEHCRHLKYIKNITMLTNCNTQINFDGSLEIIRKLKEANVNLTIIENRAIGAAGESSTAPQRVNTQLLEDFARRGRDEGVDAKFVNFEEVLADLEIPNTRKVKPVVTFKGVLRLGNPNMFEDTMRIPVERYPFVKVATAPTASAYAPKKTANGGGTWTGQQEPEGPKPLSRKIVYEIDEKKKEGEQETETTTKVKQVELKDLQKGYMYGKTLVPLSPLDEASLRFETEAGLDILGFVEREKIRPWMLMSAASVTVYRTGDQYSRLCLSSVVQQMMDQGLYAIARLVTKDGRAPVMVALIPLIDEDMGVEGLVDCELPFSEDVRTYRFPSLETIKTIKGKVLTEHHYLPTKEMVDDMRAFVTAMDVSCLTASDLQSDNGVGEEFGAPGMVFNPVIANINRAIQFRALHPEEPIPQPPAELLRAAMPPATLVDLATSIADRLQTSLKVKKISKSKTNKEKYKAEVKRELGEAALAELLGSSPSEGEGRASKRARRSEDEDEYDIDEELARWEKMPATAETDAALERIFQSACKRITALVSDERAGTAQIIAQMTRLRAAAVRLDEVQWYNDYAVVLQDALAMSSKAGLGVWESLVQGGHGVVK